MNFFQVNWLAASQTFKILLLFRDIFSNNIHIKSTQDKKLAPMLCGSREKGNKENQTLSFSPEDF